MSDASTADEADRKLEELATKLDLIADSLREKDIDGAVGAIKGYGDEQDCPYCMAIEKQMLAGLRFVRLCPDERRQHRAETVIEEAEYMAKLLRDKKQGNDY